MTEFAKLVMTADASRLKSGETALDSLAREAAQAEVKVRKASSGMGDALSGLGLSSAVSSRAVAGALGAIAGAALSMLSVTASLSQARGFNAALSETSTLIEGTSSQMQRLEDDARSMAVEFGTNATEQMQAFYEALSGGASSVEEASALVEQANKLAVGGVTQTQTAVDVLTTATNAYGKEVLSLADASDSMFTGVLAGKLTMSQLAGSLGNVIPIASAAGVSFDELNAGLAALTTQGLSISTASTSLRAVLSAVIAPTEQAKEAANALGLEFSAQALKAKGLSGFLEDVIAKTNGNKEAMAKLFGSVEALGAIFAFAGGAGTKFDEILGMMETKAGATDKAVEKMAESLDGRWKRAVAAGNDLLLTFGNAALAVVVPSLEALASVAMFASDNADVLIASIATLAAYQLPALVASAASAVAWLGTMEGLFISGAVASKALALAMSAIPFFAIVAGAVAVYRAFGESASRAEELAAALDEVSTSQQNLNTATDTFYREMNENNLNAMRTQAEAAVSAVEAAMSVAQAELKAAEFMTNFFGVNLWETERASAAKAQIEALEVALIEAQARLSAVEHSAINMGTAVGEAAVNVENLSAEAVATADQMLAKLLYQNELSAATLKYGKDSVEVLKIKNAEAIRALQAEMDLAKITGVTRDKILEAARAGFALNEGLQASAGASGALMARVSGIAGALRPAASAAWELFRALSSAASAFGGAVSSMMRLSAAGSLVEKASGALGGLASKFGLGGASTALKNAADGMSNLWKQTQVAADSGKTLEEVLNGGGTGGSAGSGGGVAGAADDATKAAEKLAEELNAPVKTAIGSVADAFADFVLRGFKDFKGFVKSVLASFKQMLATMISTAIKNKIMIGLGLSTTGIAGTAGASPLGGAASGGGFLGGIGNLLGGIGTAFGAGLSSVFTGLTTGGLSGAFSAIGTALGGATASLTGFATAAGAVALPLLAIAGIFSFFKKKVTQLDAGIRVSIDGLTTLTETFKIIETKRFWGLSKSVDSYYTAAEKALSDVVQDTYSKLRSSVIDMGKVLDFGAERLDGFIAQLKISTQGMTEDQAQKAILEEFNSLGNDLADRILGTSSTKIVDYSKVEKLKAEIAALRLLELTRDRGLQSSDSAKLSAALSALAIAEAGTVLESINAELDELRRVGEGSLDFLARISSGFSAANLAMRALGFSLYDTTNAGIAGATALIDAAGGIEAFQNATQFYFENFYSDQERLAFSMQELSSNLSKIGIDSPVPTTESGFRDLVDSLMAQGKSEEAIKLMQLSPAFLQLLELQKRIEELGGAADEAAAALAAQIADQRKGLKLQLWELRGQTDRIRALELQALDPSNRALQRLIWRLTDAAEVASERAGLEERLLELQGKTADLRALELEKLDPSNRALQEMIWSLEDAQEALENLNENDFSSLFDFDIAKARAKVASSSVAPERLRDLSRERESELVRQRERRESKREEDLNSLLQASLEINKSSMLILRRWDKIGMPKEQT